MPPPHHAPIFQTQYKRLAFFRSRTICSRIRQRYAAPEASPPPDSLPVLAVVDIPCGPPVLPIIDVHHDERNMYEKRLTLQIGGRGKKHHRQPRTTSPSPFLHPSRYEGYALTKERSQEARTYVITQQSNQREGRERVAAGIPPLGLKRRRTDRARANSVQKQQR